MKKKFSVFLCASLIFSFSPLTVSAAEMLSEAAAPEAVSEDVSADALSEESIALESDASAYDNASNPVVLIEGSNEVDELHSYIFSPTSTAIYQFRFSNPNCGINVYETETLDQTYEFFPDYGSWDMGYRNDEQTLFYATLEAGKSYKVCNLIVDDEDSSSTATLSILPISPDITELIPGEQSIDPYTILHFKAAADGEYSFRLADGSLRFLLRLDKQYFPLNYVGDSLELVEGEDAYFAIEIPQGSNQLVVSQFDSSEQIAEKADELPSDDMNTDIREQNTDPVISDPTPSAAGSEELKPSAKTGDSATPILFILTGLAGTALLLFSGTRDTGQRSDK